MPAATTGRRFFLRESDYQVFIEALVGGLVSDLHSTFRLVGTPYVLAPGTPKPQVQILQEAFRKALRDPEFHREFKKLSGFDASPLMPEEQDKAIRELPRDRDVVELFKKLAGADPLPPR
jgi:hypothetical protein